MEELRGTPPKDKTRGPDRIAPGFHVEVKPHARHIPPSFRKGCTRSFIINYVGQNIIQYCCLGCPASVQVI